LSQEGLGINSYGQEEERATKAEQSSLVRTAAKAKAGGAGKSPGIGVEIGVAVGELAILRPLFLPWAGLSACRT